MAWPGSAVVEVGRRRYRDADWVISISKAKSVSVQASYSFCQRGFKTVEGVLLAWNSSHL